MKSHLTLILAILLLLAGCSKKEESQANSAEPSTTPATEQSGNQPSTPATEQATAVKKSAAAEKTMAPARAAKAEVKPLVIPEGTSITIRTATALSSESSEAGETFAASLEQPIELSGNVVAAKGADVTGKVVDAKKKGKIKGEARLQLTLTSLTIKGQPYSIHTTMTKQVSQGKGKRTAVATGGGAGLGAIIGGIAGGGKGAAIGALVGGGAGLAGGALTGNKQIELPAETVLTFKLDEPITVK
jgi:hypothetical protein